jgi:hypothetical protein
MPRPLSAFASSEGIGTVDPKIHGSYLDHPSEGHVVAGRRFGTQETKGQDPLSSQVAKSRYTKPRIGLV